MWLFFTCKKKAYLSLWINSLRGFRGHLDMVGGTEWARLPEIVANAMQVI